MHLEQLVLHSHKVDILKLDMCMWSILKPLWSQGGVYNNTLVERSVFQHMEYLAMKCCVHVCTNHPDTDFKSYHVLRHTPLLQTPSQKQTTCICLHDLNVVNEVLCSSSANTLQCNNTAIQ